jgi:hypothetical protein
VQKPARTGFRTTHLYCINIASLERSRCEGEEAVPEPEGGTSGAREEQEDLQVENTPDGFFPSGVLFFNDENRSSKPANK